MGKNYKNTDIMIIENCKRTLFRCAADVYNKQGMSRPSFRPRPIDYAKPLPIIKSSKDLRNEDDVVVNRALPAIATGVDPAEEEERHLQQALLASVYGENSTAASADIPIPVVSTVQPPSYPGREGPFKRPPKYIRFNKSDEQLEQVTIDYDADFEDEKFVREYNEAHKGSALTLGILEKAMDVLEKKQGNLENEDKVIVPYAAIRDSLSVALNSVSETCRAKMFAHWAARREVHPEPFLRYYQKQPDPSDPNPAVAFRPRDRDVGAAAGRRLNTYENFRRAKTLREAFERLSEILQSCIKRDRMKLEALSVNALQTRLQMVDQGGPRAETASHRALLASKDSVVVAGDPPATMLPASDLQLPSGIPVSALPEERASAIAAAEKAAAAAAAEKAPKKAVRRASRATTATASSSSDKGVTSAAARTRAVGHAIGVDNYGFDEHGNRFLKHMRYFAGGFMNYGVSPYDHRVFAAASERNTVRSLPREPAPVQMPSSAVPFASLPDRSAARAALARHAFLRSRAGKPLLPLAKRRCRHPLRVRGRVGRGGRIIFDRVTYERERGVKAASYPASVEMGGVYTAGLPLEGVGRTLREGATYGALGKVALLEPRGIAEESDSGESAKDEYATLVRPLRPVVPLARGTPREDGVIDYWPRRRRTGAKLGRGGKRAPKMPRIDSISDDDEARRSATLNDVFKQRVPFSSSPTLVTEIVAEHDLSVTSMARSAM